MRSLAVVLLRLLALWLIVVQFVPSLGPIGYHLTSRMDDSDMLRYYVTQAATSLTLLLLLFLAAPMIAKTITPKGAENVFSLFQAELTKTGFLLLGVFFVIAGIADLAQEMPTFLHEFGSAARDHGHVIELNMLWFTAGPALVEGIAGGLLWRWAAKR
jgi:hypothetical protein